MDTHFNVRHAAVWWRQCHMDAQRSVRNVVVPVFVTDPSCRALHPGSHDVVRLRSGLPFNTCWYRGRPTVAITACSKQCGRSTEASSTIPIWPPRQVRDVRVRSLTLSSHDQALKNRARLQQVRRTLRSCLGTCRGRRLGLVHSRRISCDILATDNSLTQFSWQDLAVHAHVEKTPSEPKRFIRGNIKIRPVMEVKVINHFDRDGLEMKIDSMQNDGT